MMDKKTIGILAACMLALFGLQALVNQIWKPIPKKTRPVAATNEVATATGTQESATAASSTNAPAAPPVLQAPTAPAEPRPPEQKVALSNEHVRVEFTSYGGGISEVELRQYQGARGNVKFEMTSGAPALALIGLPGSESVYVFSEQTATSVVAQAKLADGVTITKRFALSGDYLIAGSAQVSATVTQPVQLAIGQAAPLHPDETLDMVGVDWLNLSRDDARGVKATGYQHRSLPELWSDNVHKLYSRPVTSPWGAVKNQFFAMVLTPSTNATMMHYMPHRLAHPAEWPPKAQKDAVTAALEVPATRTAEGSSWSFTLYAGPKEYNRLKALGKAQEDVMQFGMWSFISIILLKSMKFFHSLIPNWGVAIIIVTILIKLVFWPVQAKSIKSMKAMQKFQPLMAKLKEKYKDDPQRMNAEMMKLYKEHKINPLSGCLPMLVQIPVFFALFAMLRSAVELRGAGFLWVHDLSQPDTIFHLAGLPVNPLPLLMTGSMIWQMKLTPTTGDAQQQKIMMYLMPLMMLFFFYNASSGLALYWTVQQFLSIAQQWWSMRQPETGTAVPIPRR